MGKAGHNPSWPEEHWALSRGSSRQGTLLFWGPVSCEGPIHLWLSLHPLKRTAQPWRPLSAAVALSGGVGSEPGCWGQCQGCGPESPYSPKSLEHICSMRPSALSSISHWAQILVTEEREQSGWNLKQLEWHSLLQQSPSSQKLLCDSYPDNGVVTSLEIV